MSHGLGKPPPLMFSIQNSYDISQDGYIGFSFGFVLFVWFFLLFVVFFS